MSQGAEPMKMRFALLCVFLTVAALSRAEAPMPGLLLVKGIYGLPGKDAEGRMLRYASSGVDGGAGECVAVAEPDVANPAVCMPHISDDFLDAIGYSAGVPESALARLGEQFDLSFRQFKVEQVTPRNKFRTYAVSLQVASAGRFQADLGQFVDVFLPLTLNMYFTNILTGEVLYSLSRTDYRNLRVSQADYADKVELKAKVMESYQANYNALVRDLMQEASQKFRPLQIDAPVLRIWKGYYVLGKGLDKGIASGSELATPEGAGVRVIYADRNYAIAVPSLGDVKAGEVVSLFSTASASSVKKPRVMVMDAHSPLSYPGQFVAREFAESIGDGASFTLVAVNPSFQSVLRAVMQTEGLQQAEVGQSRALPDYFIRIWLPDANIYDLPTSQSFARTRVSVGSIHAEMIDRSGRVVFSASVNDEIVEQVVSGLAIDRENRLRILYGNLVSALAKKFVAGVQFNATELAVDQVQGSMYSVADPAGLLAVNQVVRAFRSDNDIVAGLGNVRVPIWELQVAERKDGVAMLTPVAPTSGTLDDALKLRRGDLIVLEGGRSGASRISLELCASSKDIGTVKIEALPALAHYGMGQWLKAPFFVGDQRISTSSPTFSSALLSLKNVGFKQGIAGEAVRSGYCVEPLLKVTTVKRDCSDPDRCDVTTDIVAGMQFRNTDAAIGKRALNVRLESKGVPEGVIDQYVTRKVEVRLQELFRELAEQADMTVFP